MGGTILLEIVFLFTTIIEMCILFLLYKQCWVRAKYIYIFFFFSFGVDIVFLMWQEKKDANHLA